MCATIVGADTATLERDSAVPAAALMRRQLLREGACYE